MSAPPVANLPIKFLHPIFPIAESSIGVVYFASMQTPGTVITGALGGVGMKSMLFLAEHTDCPAIVGLDYKAADSEQLQQLAEAVARRAGPSPEIRLITADLTDWEDQRWRQAVADAKAIVHLAASNTNPDCSWEEASSSLAMTFNLARIAAEQSSFQRFIFASSNHVMDGYLHTAEFDAMGPGSIDDRLPPRPGGHLHFRGDNPVDTTPYCTSKLSGEGLLRGLCHASGGRLTAVCIRIGAMRREGNVASIGKKLLEQAEAKHPDASTARRQERQWLLEMRISDKDWYQLLKRALIADGRAWPGGVAIVNGVSANTGMKWSLEPGRRYLDYEPEDDFVSSD